VAVDPGAAFSLAVRSCQAQSTPAAKPAVDSSTRLPSVTWIQAPSAGLVPNMAQEARGSPRPQTPQDMAWGEQVSRISFRHGVDARLVEAVIHVESRHRASARSPKGALGLMQVMPATGARYGVARAQDLLDPAVNLDVGVRYLRDLLLQFGGQIELALAAYNAGAGHVLRYGLRVPPFPETRDYVDQVMARYDWLCSAAVR